MKRWAQAAGWHPAPRSPLAQGLVQGAPECSDPGANTFAALIFHPLKWKGILREFASDSNLGDSIAAAQNNMTIKLNKSFGDSRFKIDCFLSFLSSAKELNAHGFLQKPTLKTISEPSFCQNKSMSLFHDVMINHNMIYSSLLYTSGIFWLLIVIISSNSQDMASSRTLVDGQ